MKAKSKILLALSVLTAGTLAAGATSTFAWFTTSRTATLTYQKVSVVNNNGNLVAKLYDLNAAKDAWDSAAVDSVADSALTMTELSSQDGMSFAKPTWALEAGGAVASVSTAPAVGTDYAIFLVELENTGDTNLAVYLDKGTQIAASASSDANNAAAKLTRVAVNYAGTSKPDAAKLASSTKTILFENDYTESGKPADFTCGKYMNAEGNTVDVTTTNHLTTEFTECTSKTVADGTKQGLTNALVKNEKQYYVVTAWLEGTKTTGTFFNTAEGGSVDITLKLVAFDA